MRRTSPAVTIVIPLFNEEKGVKYLFAALNKVRSRLPKKTDVILVDDGSKDRTFQLLQKSHLAFPKKVLRFSRNFGHQAALLAGLQHAKGDYVVTMDGDLQHPPLFILDMLQQHARGIDIVLTQRLDGQVTSPFKKITARLFYMLLNRLSEQQLSENVSDFRSMNRRSVNALLAMPEKRKFLRGMVNWIGFSTIILPFHVRLRVAGQSKYSLLKMLKLAFHGITSFSTVPLSFAAVFSCCLFFFAFVYGVYVLYARLVLGNVVSGWASVLFVLLVTGGFTSLFLGVIGFYLAAIYDEVKQRPEYIIKERYEQKQ